MRDRILNDNVECSCCAQEDLTSRKNLTGCPEGESDWLKGTTWELRNLKEIQLREGHHVLHVIVRHE